MAFANSAITIGRHVRRAMMAVSIVAFLAGCSGMTEMSMESMAIDPGHYDHYDCKQIEAAIVSAQTTELELRRLMERSSQGAGGDFVNIIAYRSDYARTRASLKLLKETAANKHCNTQSKWTSKRSIW